MEGNSGLAELNNVGSCILGALWKKYSVGLGSDRRSCSESHLPHPTSGHGPKISALMFLDCRMTVEAESGEE